MKSIVLIIPYFGPFRPDFKFWLKSVSKNPTIDFLLLTDNAVKSAPHNLKVVQTTFAELKNKIQRAFNFDICLSQPYKLCDFRPCYGEVFADLIKDYDFWGYTDMDMVYGDICHFIKEEMLVSYDRILGLGHFSLFRNTPKINSMYKSVEQPSYRQVFTFPCGCAFDEYWGLSRYMDKNMHDKFYQAYPFDDVDCMKYPFHAQMRRHEDVGKRNFIYAYENGKLYRIYEYQGKLCKDETMYVHFQKRSMEIRTDVSDYFMMIPNSYVPYIQNLTLDKLRSFSVENKCYPHAYELQWKRIADKWKKVKASFRCSKFGTPQLPKDGMKYYIEDKTK